MRTLLPLYTALVALFGDPHQCRRSWLVLPFFALISLSLAIASSGSLAQVVGPSRVLVRAGDPLSVLPDAPPVAGIDDASINNRGQIGFSAFLEGVLYEQICGIGYNAPRCGADRLRLRAADCDSNGLSGAGLRRRVRRDIR
jgi:hypothetical protein